MGSNLIQLLLIPGYLGHWAAVLDNHITLLNIRNTFHCWYFLGVLRSGFKCQTLAVFGGSVSRVVLSLNWRQTTWRSCCCCWGGCHAGVLRTARPFVSQSTFITVQLDSAWRHSNTHSHMHCVCVHRQRDTHCWWRNSGSDRRRRDDSTFSRSSLFLTATHQHTHTHASLVVLLFIYY